MEYLKSGWKTVVGAQPSVMDEQPNVAETVERLVERVETSTLLEDRRDACRALKSLSKTYRLEVGTKAMDPLLFVLQNDSNDNEIVAFALETLNNIIGTDEDINSDSGNDLSIQFTEIFIKRKENVQLVIDLLAEFDFKIRWPTIKLLYSLLRNKLRECQDCILTYPMGISRMMDLLLDPREVIRNDALLLLVYLTKNNTNIQKIVAFENAFDRILDIVSSEGCSDGGIIVEDCLSILLNLLKTNTSNQNFFKEGSYINRLLPFLDFSFETNWNSQKINNLLLMFKVIRSLVSPKNPLQVTSACQKVMMQNEVLQKLCAIQMSNGLPVEILTEIINCVAEVIRGNQVNQDYFSRVMAPTEPPKPVIVILLMSMINEKQPFELRCAVLYCFQCFLYKNDLGQAQILETLLPKSTDVQTESAGQILCGGFFSKDPLSNWFVAVALSYALGNVTQKEQLLRVQLTTDGLSPPTSLLAYCSNLLQQGGHYQRRVSLLMLLSTWLCNSPLVVSNFLSISTNIPYLTSQVGLIEGDEVELIIQGLCAFLLGLCICYNDNSVQSFTKDDLCQIIANRVGKEIYIDKLSMISKNEKYSQAIQKPQLSYLKASDVLFDYEFCNLFRHQESSILKIIHPSSGNDDMNNSESSLLNEDHKLLTKYKELIRQQDEQLTSLRKQLIELKGHNEYLQHQLNDQHSIIQQLRDQIALLKAQKSVYDPTTSSVTSSLIDTTSSIQNQMEQQPSYNPQTIDNAQQNSNPIYPGDNDPYHNSNYITDNQNNNESNEINQIENQLEGLQINVENSISTDNNSNVGKTAHVNQVDYLINENRRLLSIIDQYKYWEQHYYAYYNQQQLGSLSTQVNVSDSDISRTEPDTNKPAGGDANSEVEKLKAELESMKKEQDDLLSLIGDQNLKLQYYEKEFKHNDNSDVSVPDNSTHNHPTIAATDQNQHAEYNSHNLLENHFMPMLIVNSDDSQQPLPNNNADNNHLTNSMMPIQENHYSYPQQYDSNNDIINTNNINNCSPPPPSLTINYNTNDNININNNHEQYNC